MTVTGLFLIANDGSKRVNYKKIWLGLIGVILGKSGYGIVINRLKETCSSTLTMCIGLALICVIMLFYYNPVQDLKKNPKGIGKLSAVRVVNTVGSLVENHVATLSVISYSLIQPLILIVMFTINLIQREKTSPKGIFGGLICIVGIVALQLTR
jgi:drug/metabolite transporter (DMT)-like permease